MIHSFLSLGSKNVKKKNENTKATGAKIHAPVLGQNFPKPAIVLGLQYPLSTDPSCWSCY